MWLRNYVHGNENGALADAPQLAYASLDTAALRAPRVSHSNDTTLRFTSRIK